MGLPYLFLFSSSKVCTINYWAIWGRQDGGRREKLKSSKGERLWVEKSLPLLFEKNIETEREIEDVGLKPTKKRGVKERER